MTRQKNWIELRSLGRDRSGATAVIFALGLAGLAGVVALSVNLPQMWNLHSQLQHAVDAACLTGVTQLDKEDGARSRAIQVASGNLVVNQQNFAYVADDGAADPAVVTFDSNTDPGANTDFTFYVDLGDPSASPPVAPTVATTDQEANYMEVKADDRPVSTPFWALLGGVDVISPVARATCFAETAYCNIPPIFACAPVDAGGNVQIPDASDIGRGVWLRGKDPPSSGQLFPGNFGLLCLKSESGEETCKAQDIADALARVGGSPACYAQSDDMTTKTGETQGPVQNGLNMRMGIYPNGAHKVPSGEPPVESNPNYAADNNPVKGLLKGANCKENSWSQPLVTASCLDGACRFSDPLATGATDYPTVIDNIESMTFPRDSCAYDCSSGNSGNACDTAKATGSCRPGTDDGGRFGDGDWDIDTYLAKTHGIAPGTWNAQGIDCFRCDAGINPQIPTRNEVLKWELANVLAGPPGTTQEDLQNNHPQCGTPPTGTADRRFMPIVMTDCTNVDPGKTTVQVSKVMIVLLTEGVGFGPENDNKNLYGEITEVSDAGGAGNILEDLTIRVFKLAR